MLKKFIVSLIFVSFIMTPFSYVKANDEYDTNTLFLAQLNAIADYLLRLSSKDNGVSSQSDLVKYIEDGVEWIINSQEETGHFRYEYVPYEGRYNDDDNIVRQAGTLYALAEVYRQQNDKNPELEAAIEKAIIYWQSLMIYGGEDGDFRCAVDPVKNQDCRLGANSLALLGILSYVNGAPEKLPDYQAIIDDLVGYIKLAKKPEAGFRDKYRNGVGWLSAESPFSNGEALLALVRYYQLEPDPEVKLLIDEVYAYLAAEEYDSGLYLWIMAALKDMNQLWPNDDYVAYAESFTDWRVDRTAYRRGTDKNYCAYSEGLASAYSVLEDSISDNKLIALKAELDYWNKHNSTLQVHSTDLFRLTNNDNVLTLSFLDKPSLAHGGFLTSHSNVVQRIDFTQHCVSAYLQTLVDIEGGTI